MSQGVLCVMDRFTVIDLFAGAGGLSFGFTQTNEYEIKVAFENSPYMQETYKRNHQGVTVMGDVCAAKYDEIEKEYGKIDVVIGGPPCQGFSNANRQKNHVISKNNMLVKQYIRAILELQPKGFVMENVSMLRSEVHRFFMSKDDKPIIKKYEIETKNTPLCLLEEEYAFWGASAIVKDTERVNHYLWPEAHYAELNVVLKYSKNEDKLKKTLEKHKTVLQGIALQHIKKEEKDYVIKKDAEAFKAVLDYYDGWIDGQELVQLITPAIMIQRMLNIAKEISDNNIVVDSYSAQKGVIANIRSFAVFDYLQAILGSDQNGYVIDKDVLCAADYGAPQKRMRFVVMGVKKEIAPTVKLPRGLFAEKGYRTVRDAIGDLESIDPITEIEQDCGIPIEERDDLGELGASLRNSDVLMNHIVTKTTDVALKRFTALKQGENFHSLDDDLKNNTYTDASRTQNTIYLRLNYDEPSGTVVNVRKSMWIHPTLDRAISVREAARLQTFPDSFVFIGSKDKQYQQVGNAVPPIMAKSIAEKLAEYLSSDASDCGENG